MNKLTQFWMLARGKLTTWLALSVAGFSQLSDHAEEIRTSWPALRGYLPSGDWVDHASHAILSALGLVIVYSRVRRLLHPPTSAPEAAPVAPAPRSPAA
jgi:hypothetical protein